ncbi:hypothetical protein GJ744_002453 [Endocarpon pusillum]|uniref:Uncharacterized protein n=1 Tax=Endocarpon pusillum TaxID=364733 RepID=A0A8H7A867_9EURO|nr:hypothetical protein GJ744_002453 [Endocarpon pusillum]
MDEADQPVPSQEEVEHRPLPLGWVSELVHDPSDANMGIQQEYQETDKAPWAQAWCNKRTLKRKAEQANLNVLLEHLIYCTTESGNIHLSKAPREASLVDDLPL